MSEINEADRESKVSTSCHVILRFGLLIILDAAREKWEAAVDLEMSAGAKTRIDAIQRVDKKDPSLHETYIRLANAERHPE